jgi:hypothetical protein
MENAGFRIARVEGDFTGGPLVQDSDVMVVQARLGSRSRS